MTNTKTENNVQDLNASEKSNCKSCSKEFLIIPQEKVFYKRKKLPLPNECPQCRQKRRLSFRNERNLHKRTCDKCGENIISTYRADSPYIIYCQECYWNYLDSGK